MTCTRRAPGDGVRGEREGRKEKEGGREGGRKGGMEAREASRARGQPLASATACMDSAEKNTPAPPAPPHRRRLHRAAEAVLQHRGGHHLDPRAGAAAVLRVPLWHHQQPLRRRPPVGEAVHLDRHVHVLCDGKLGRAVAHLELRGGTRARRQAGSQCKCTLELPPLGAFNQTPAGGRAQRGGCWPAQARFGTVQV